MHCSWNEASPTQQDFVDDEHVRIEVAAIENAEPAFIRSSSA
jgi:hypothetical protein